jgi:hypothetical protein
MSRLKLAATAAALLGGLALASAAQAFTFLEIDSSGQLWDINTAVAHNNATAVGTPDIVMEGLGQLGSTVYGESANQLYSISSAGVETAIGSAVAGVTFVDFGSTTSGLFAISTTGYLYTINDTTGVATRDSLSLGLGTFASHLSTIGLSTGTGTLYFDDGTTMYSLNTGTGFATKLGTISGTPTEYGALMYATAALTGTTAGLYGGSNHDGSGSHTGIAQFAISGTAPTESFVGSLTREVSPNSAHATQFWGMVPGFGAKVVPEPSEWALMLFGVGAVGGALRGRRRKATAAA